MKTPLAWLNLMYEKNRLVVAIAGVAFAVMLVFMNLGFLGALSRAAGMIYDNINADIYLISPRALELTTTRVFPKVRLYQAASVPGVVKVMPLYLGYLQWRNVKTRQFRALFAFGINPDDQVFKMPELQTSENLAALRRWNTVLFDRRSRPEYGPAQIGIRTNAGRREVEIGGLYSMGGGFSADSTVIMSDQNYRRYFTRSTLDKVDMGLIQIQPGADVQRVVANLRRLLPPDVVVRTRQQMTEHDRDYWINTTSTGFIFGLGVAVSCVVGMVIVYQILYTDISDHLRQYATLKAIGYHSRYLFGVVLQEGLILAVLGYVPGLTLALVLYEMARRGTHGTMPIFMTWSRVVWVFGLTLLICTISALISVRKASEADPAEVFNV